MKRITFAILFILSYAFAQGQLPLLSGYAFSPSTLNPALTGYASALSIHAHYHRAYTGMIDDASTATLFADHAFGSHRAGLQLSHDVFGFDEQNMAVLQYAYQHNIAGGTLAAGIRFSGNNIKRSLTQTHPTTANDPTLGADINNTIWNAGLGLAWITSNAYFAIGTPELLNTNFSASGDVTDAGRTAPLYLNGMYRIIMNEAIEIRPVMWSVLQSGQPLLLDLQAQCVWRQHLMATLGYRNTGNWLAGVHARFNERYTIGYLYDMHSPTGTAAHELVLGFDISPTQF